MKKLLYIFLTVLIVGCSGEDSNNSNDGSNVSIEGRWNYTSYYIWDGEQSTPSGIVVGCELQNYIILDGGSGAFYYYEEVGSENDCVLWLTDEVTYEVTYSSGTDNERYVFNFTSELGDVDGELNGNTLTINYYIGGFISSREIYTRD